MIRDIRATAWTCTWDGVRYIEPDVHGVYRYDARPSDWTSPSTSTPWRLVTTSATSLSESSCGTRWTSPRIVSDTIKTAAYNTRGWLCGRGVESYSFQHSSRDTGTTYLKFYWFAPERNYNPKRLSPIMSAGENHSVGRVTTSALDSRLSRLWFVSRFCHPRTICSSTTTKFNLSSNFE